MTLLIIGADSIHMPLFTLPTHYEKEPYFFVDPISAILTRDRGFYRSYFHDMNILAP
jgi:hypothetical protein